VVVLRRPAQRGEARALDREGRGSAAPRSVAAAAGAGAGAGGAVTAAAAPAAAEGGGLLKRDMGSSSSTETRGVLAKSDRERDARAPPVERQGVVSGGGTSGSGAGVAAAAQDGAPAQQDEASEEFVVVESERAAAEAVGATDAAAPAAVVDDGQAESAADVAAGCAVAVAAAAVVQEEQMEGADRAAVARVGATAVDDAFAEGADPVAVGSGLGAIGAVRGAQSRRAAQCAAASKLAAKNARLVQTLLRCSHADKAAKLGAKPTLVRQLAKLVHGPTESITIQGRDKALRWYTHSRAAALGLATETTNRRRGTADVVVRKPQGWEMRTLEQVATALEAGGPRPSHPTGNKSSKRAKIDAWRGRCYNCGCEVSAYEAGISLSFNGHYCPACTLLPEYSPYKWEGALYRGRLYTEYCYDY
jgi:hypothetical protein